MEDKGNELIAAFDTLFTTNRIQMLKILLCRLSPSGQGTLAVYIKLLELQYTMQYFRTHSSAGIFGQPLPLSVSLTGGDNTETLKLLDELLPFSGPEEKKKIGDLKGMLQGLSRMQEMMEMLKMVQELFPDAFQTDAKSPSDLLSGLSGMGDMDLSLLLQMLGKEPS